MRQLTIDLTRCDGGCSCAHACEAACAVKAFKLQDRAGAALHIQVLDGKPSAILCDQCGDCLAVCPSQALRRNKLGVVMIDKNLCVGCYTCVGFCAKAAFERLPGRIEPYKCTACGICVKACPLGALALEEVPEPEPAII